MDFDHRNAPKVVGIDLAGSAKRNTGVCTLGDDHVTSCTVLHPDEVLGDFKSGAIVIPYSEKRADRRLKKTRGKRMAR